MTAQIFLDKILKKSEVISTELGVVDLIKIKENAGYASVLLFKQAILRLSETKNGARIDVKKFLLSCIKVDPLSPTYTKSSPEWGRFPLTNEVADAILNNLKSIFSKCYSMLSEATFGCCHRFEECSNNKKCICPDKLFASGCMYRLNLESGKIFYGKNRNV